MVKSAVELIQRKRQIRNEMKILRGEICQKIKPFNDATCKSNIQNNFIKLITTYYGKFILPNGRSQPGFRPLVVSGYCTIGSEFDCIPLLKFVHSLGHKCCLPVVSARKTPLTFREWTPKTIMEPDKLNILIPSSINNVVIDIQPDLIIAPLLAYDSTGSRLGYGGGYYDRTLAQLKQKENFSDGILRYPIITCGLAFSEQLIDYVPVNIHDYRLDSILTEKTLTLFKPII